MPTPITHLRTFMIMPLAGTDKTDLQHLGNQLTDLKSSNVQIFNKMNLVIRSSTGPVSQGNYPKLHKEEKI
jgi:hypothetical protein